MIITLIGLGLLVVGIALAIINNKVRFKSWKAKDNIGLLKFICFLVGGTTVFCASILILINITNYDVEYQNTLHEKEMLEYRIEHMEENITGNEMLYNDIVEFNNELRNTKKWANNPWTNWFNNEKIASIDYIEIPGIG